MPLALLPVPPYVARPEPGCDFLLQVRQAAQEDQLIHDVANVMENPLGVGGSNDLGDLVEHGPTEMIFSQPSKQQTEDYITGRFG